MQIEPTLPIRMDPSTPQPAVQRSKPNSVPTDSGVRVEEIDQIISNLAKAVEPFDVALKFSKDQETGAIVVEMISQTTGETLQQIPNAAMLHVAAVLGKLQGQIFNRKA